MCTRLGLSASAPARCLAIRLLFAGVCEHGLIALCVSIRLAEYGCPFVVLLLIFKYSHGLAHVSTARISKFPSDNIAGNTVNAGQRELPARLPGLVLRQLAVLGRRGIEAAIAVDIALRFEKRPFTGIRTSLPTNENASDQGRCRDINIRWAQDAKSRRLPSGEGVASTFHIPLHRPRRFSILGQQQQASAVGTGSRLQSIDPRDLRRLHLAMLMSSSTSGKSTRYIHYNSLGDVS